MSVTRLLAALCCLGLLCSRADAQAPPKEPPPLWDTELGASFVGTSGNSDTSTAGADFEMHRRWPVWQIEAAATAVRTTDRGATTAERYLGTFRAKRTLTPAIGFTGGERAERDPLAGISFRSILDAGLTYALVRDTRWTLDGLTSLAWNHETSTHGPDLDDPVAVLQLASRVPFSATADSSQRFTFYPDLRHSGAYRSEAEATAQAAMNARLALKIGYLWRYSNAPVPGFVKSDNTVTASIVLRWKAATSAP
jgi:putative salt-induced outer membrane protein YdiY